MQLHQNHHLQVALTHILTKLQLFSDYTQKSPSAVDFFDIEDAVDDVKVLLHVFIQAKEIVDSEKVWNNWLHNSTKVFH